MEAIRAPSPVGQTKDSRAAACSRPRKLGRMLRRTRRAPRRGHDRLLARRRRPCLSRVSIFVATTPHAQFGSRFASVMGNQGRAGQICFWWNVFFWVRWGGFGWVRVWLVRMGLGGVAQRSSTSGEILMMLAVHACQVTSAMQITA